MHERIRLLLVKSFMLTNYARLTNTYKCKYDANFCISFWEEVFVLAKQMFNFKARNNKHYSKFQKKMWFFPEFSIASIFEASMIIRFEWNK
jgi:hypothetical protein